MKRKHFALASAIATLALTATAGPAAAQTAVGPLSDPAGQVSYGTGWAAGAPAGPGLITWNFAAGTTQPVLSGNLYFRNAPGVTGRMLLRYLDSAGNIVVTQSDSPHNGVAGGLATFPVAFGGIASGSTNLRVDLVRNGMVVDSATCNIAMAAC